jgi:hypothetical protein
MRILVAYASKHGATQGIAERIAGQLSAAGIDTDAQSVSAVGDLAGYRLRRLRNCSRARAEPGVRSPTPRQFPSALTRVPHTGFQVKRLMRLSRVHPVPRRDA